MNRRLFLAGLGTAAAVSLRAADPIPKTDDITVKNKAVQDLFEQMRAGKYRAITFPKLSRDDIPALLQMARSKKSLTSFPRNPFSSQAQTECPEGMIALWLIEGWRKWNQHPSLNALCLPTQRTLGGNWDDLSKQNHDRCRDAYEAWWKHAEKLTDDELKKINPLKDVPLAWYGSAPEPGEAPRKP